MASATNTKMSLTPILHSAEHSRSIWEGWGGRDGVRVGKEGGRVGGIEKGWENRT